MCEIPPNIPSDFKNLASLARLFFPSLPLPLPRAHAQSGKNGLVHETSYIVAWRMDSSAMEGTVHSHRDFRVRKSVVHRALNWLVTHNQYYRSNHVHVDVNALEQLPHDGNLSQRTSIRVESASTEPPATNTPLQLVLL